MDASTKADTMAKLLGMGARKLYAVTTGSEKLPITGATLLADRLLLHAGSGPAMTGLDIAPQLTDAQHDLPLAVRLPGRDAYWAVVAGAAGFTALVTPLPDPDPVAEALDEAARLIARAREADPDGLLNWIRNEVGAACALLTDPDLAGCQDATYMVRHVSEVVDRKASVERVRVLLTIEATRKLPAPVDPIFPEVVHDQEDPQQAG